MAGARHSETYRATLATAFGVQDIRLRVSWRRQRHLTRIVLEFSSDDAPSGDITAVLGLVPCSVVTTDASVIRSSQGGTALMVGLGPDDRTGRVRRTAIVANVGPYHSPVADVEIEGRDVPAPRRWARSAATSIIAGVAATVVALGAGVAVREVVGNRTVAAVSLAGESALAVNPVDENAATTSSTASPPAAGAAPAESVLPGSAPGTTDGGTVADSAVDATTIDAALMARVTSDVANWLVIPRIDLVSPIVRGVDDADLVRGVGRYVTTARIGAAGNLGLAGHRTTPPAPFRHLDSMQVGDTVFIVTPTEVLRYEVEEAAPGRASIEVRPETVSVLDGRGHDGLTLTTCTPVGTTERRLIVFARLVERGPRVGAGSS